MDPTTTCCPNVGCPARGQSAQGHIGIQARRACKGPCQTSVSGCTFSEHGWYDATVTCPTHSACGVRIRRM
jgi:hypothetical protein